MFLRRVTDNNKALAVSFLFFSLCLNPVFAEEKIGTPLITTVDSSLSWELQAYWTGVINGITFERFFTPNDAWHVRLGLQRIRHEDYGEHDDERGDGYGGSLGYRRYWSSGLSVGARVDLWQNSINWTDAPGTTSERIGVTEVTVLQPVVESSWRKVVSSNWFVQPSAALGAEINIIKDGEDTGQGFIWLLAVSLGRYLR